MSYILNTPLKEKKRCAVALLDIFGLGKGAATQVCDQLGFSSQIKCKQLNANQIDRLTRCISADYICNVDLRELLKKNREQNISISSYRGFRYIEGLPCRGQRTHGNAQTTRRSSARSTLPAVKTSSKRNTRLRSRG